MLSFGHEWNSHNFKWLLNWAFISSCFKVKCYYGHYFTIKCNDRDNHQCNKKSYITHLLKVSNRNKFFHFFFSSSPEDILIDLRERGREGENHQYKREALIGCLLLCTWTMDWTLNLDICPHWELNPQPSGLWLNLQATEPHQLGQVFHF